MFKLKKKKKRKKRCQLELGKTDDKKQVKVKREKGGGQCEIQGEK